MNELNVDQKIELITLASKLNVPIGRNNTDAEKTIQNYKKLLKAITIPQKLVSITLKKEGLSVKKKP